MLILELEFLTGAWSLRLLSTHLSKRPLTLRKSSQMWAILGNVTKKIRSIVKLWYWINFLCFFLFSTKKSNEDVIGATDIEDLLSGQCYKGVNGQIANKNCQVLETRAYACKAPIDASNYIGVAFDITKGYGQAGFRGAIVKVSYLEFLFMFFVCVFYFSNNFQTAVVSRRSNIQKHLRRSRWDAYSRRLRDANGTKNL